MIADFVLSLDGVVTFRIPQFQKDPPVRGTEGYFKRRADLKQDRAYFFATCGTKDAPDFPSVRDKVIAEMRRLAGGQLQKDGVLCIFGSSNGAAHALALAAALQNELTVNYICLADLPLFTGGRAVPGVGSLLASNPVMTRGMIGKGGARFVHARDDRPTVSLQPDITAKLKQNFYQNSGNGTKVGILSGKWFWTSDMKNEEFHGVIGNGGWNNDQEITGLTVDNPTLRAIFGGEGDAFHAALDDHVEGKIWTNRWPVELAKF
jgi:hypothetical protein